ncbi:MAG: hypothetical protein ACI8ZX_001625 [Planctomycetota bacterium]|jgi:hypothetical protein
MEIQGKVKKILPMQTGESTRGGWKKQEFILETTGQYPKQVCIALWGDKIEQSNITEGEDITASINVESREFNERWYTDVKAWKIQKGMVAAAPQAASAPAASNTPPPPSAADMPTQSDDMEDDLPF